MLNVEVKSTRWLEDCKTECEYVIIDDIDETQFNEQQYS